MFNAKRNKWTRKQNKTGLKTHFEAQKQKQTKTKKLASCYQRCHQNSTSQPPLDSIPTATRNQLPRSEEREIPASCKEHPSDRIHGTKEVNGNKKPISDRANKGKQSEGDDVNTRVRALHISESTATKHSEEKCMQIRIWVETMKVRAK